jgi:hypothetical protein
MILPREKEIIIAEKITCITATFLVVGLSVVVVVGRYVNIVIATIFVCLLELSRKISDGSGGANVCLLFTIMHALYSKWTTPDFGVHACGFRCLYK